MIKRSFDITVSTIGLCLFSPLLIGFSFAIWIYDRGSPFYIATRVGINGRTFKMIKLRSMVVNADKIGSSSTSGNDLRITPIGQFVRAYKVDEFVNC